MTDRYLFRGKRKDGGDWAYGDLLHDDGRIFICWEEDGDYCEAQVIPETVGQCTGLCDKNGNKMFEGDIVKNDWCFLQSISVVRLGEYKGLDKSDDYRQGHMGFYLEHQDSFEAKTGRKDILFYADKCEVISNIHDNPELLEVIE